MFPYTRLVESAKRSRWAPGAIGVILAVAGVAIWWFSTVEQDPRATSDAQRIFGALGSDEEETLQDASTLIELSHADRSVRTAFLREALASESAADKLRLHELGISVALSQVNYSEAAVLYRVALRSKLDSGAGPMVLQECFALLARWSLISEVSPEESAKIANRLAARMGSEHDTGSLEQFSAGIATLAPRLSTESAGVLAGKLFASATTGDPGVIYDPVRALIAIAPQLSPSRRSELAVALTTRLAAERKRPVILALAPLLTPLSATLDPTTASQLSGLLATRIAEDWDTASLDPLVSAFRVVAGKVEPAEAERISVNLLQHVKQEPDPAVLLEVTQALAAFGDKLARRVYEEAGEALVKRIQVERDAEILSELALSLGILKDKARADQFDQAASQIVSRFAAEHDMQAIAALAASIDAVADDLEAPSAARLSALLVARMMEERRAGSLLYKAIGLESIADEVKGSKAAALVDLLIGRMRREESSNAMRSLAFSVAAFKNAPGTFEAAADLLVERVSMKDAPEELRDLTAGLYSLRDKIGARSFDKAASILASDIETRLDPGAVGSLATSLHALAAKAGAEPFERAASAIVANARNLTALEPALRKVATKIRPEKAQELAKILSGRIAQEQEPGRLRVLGQAFSDLPVDSVQVDLSKVLAIPNAPCQAAHSISQLFNPLCSEMSWNDLAANAVHAKPRKAADNLEPDFIQLAPDDDDDAPSGPADDEPALDFHQLSDALNGLRPPAQESAGQSGMRWSGIALLIAGVSVFLWAVRRRPRSEVYSAPKFFDR